MEKEGKGNLEEKWRDTEVHGRKETHTEVQRESERDIEIQRGRGQIHGIHCLNKAWKESEWGGWRIEETWCASKITGFSKKKRWLQTQHSDVTESPPYTPQFLETISRTLSSSHSKETHRIPGNKLYLCRLLLHRRSNTIWNVYLPQGKFGIQWLYWELAVMDAFSKICLQRTHTGVSHHTYEGSVFSLMDQGTASRLGGRPHGRKQSFPPPFSLTAFQEFLYKDELIAESSCRNAVVHIHALYVALVLHQKKKTTRRSMRIKHARCIQTYSRGGESSC